MVTLSTGGLTIRLGDASLLDLVVDTAQMLAATFGCSLLPIETSTGFAAGVDLVPVPRLRLDLVLITFRE